MTSNRVYFDHNASAPLLDAARLAMVDALGRSGNASSVHEEGRFARRTLDAARRSLAALCNADPAHVVFTSGASEAASMLLTPQWRMGRTAIAFSRLLVLESDHPCIAGGGHFPSDRVTRIGVDEQGRARLDDLHRALDGHDADTGLLMLAFHAANNETGVIQDVEAIARIGKAAGAVVVVDAVQAAGRIPLDISEGSADFLILSSHKMGGPQGAGAVIGKGDLMMPAALIRGGGQEKGHRAGTENVAAIAGFGVAADIAAAGLDDVAAIEACRDRIETIILDAVPDATIFGRETTRLPNTTFFALPGMKAETAQIAFDLAGISVSAGSACSSGKVGPSHVLKAMGQGDDASALRVSIGAATCGSDVARFEAALRALAARRQTGNRAA